MVKAKASGEPGHIDVGVPTKVIIIAIILFVALLYLLSPIDFIPDIIPILGWIDDLIVLAIALGISGAVWKR